MAAPNSTQRQSSNPNIAQLSTYSNGLYQSPLQETPGSGQLSLDVDESPYLDFDGEFDDSYNFDLNGQDMIGALPGFSNDVRSTSPDDEQDLHDKRKSVDGKDEADEGGGKRREGDEKAAKKPGRKPLTSEPTSKRKAQNRAAQRAFRDRKEKHLKDLETKVEDLQKASESANEENSLLRAQVERLQVELKEYRKRLSWVSNGGPSRTSASGSGSLNSQNGNKAGSNNDFRFEFPKFGDLPVAMFTSNGTIAKAGDGDIQSPTAPNRSTSLPNPSQAKSQSKSQDYIPTASRQTSVPATSSADNASQARQASASNPPSVHGQQNQKSNSYDDFSGLFSPSVLEASRNFEYFSGDKPHQNANSHSVIERAPSTNTVQNSLYSTSTVSNSDSPSGSSDSQRMASSNGTSPESSLNSPFGHKANDFPLNTINEENAFKSQTADGGVFASDFTANGDFNWLAQQNGGSFDPVLFGDYRESQDAIISQDFGSFFNEAFPLPDLGSPLHNFNEVTSQAPPKVDLMKQVEAAQNGEETSQTAPFEGRTKMMTCNKIWDRLQSMEKFRNGEIDVDNLCSELRAKARCSEGGAVIEKSDVDKILGTAK